MHGSQMLAGTNVNFVKTGLQVSSWWACAVALTEAQGSACGQAYSEASANSLVCAVLEVRCDRRVTFA